MILPRDPRTTSEVRIQTRMAEMYRMITMRIIERTERQTEVRGQKNPGGKTT